MRSLCNMQDTFVKNVAAVLGIDPRRIKIANIVPGRRLLANAKVGVRLEILHCCLCHLWHCNITCKSTLAAICTFHS